MPDFTVSELLRENYQGMALKIPLTLRLGLRLGLIKFQLYAYDYDFLNKEILVILKESKKSLSSLITCFQITVA